MSSKSSQMLYKKTYRFFTKESLLNVKTKIYLPEDETKHLRSSLRLREGDRCLVTDGRGCEAEAEILQLSKSNKACLKIIKIHTKPNENKKTSIKMVQAFIKKGKMDFLIEKAQELGVGEFTPILSERTNIQISNDRFNKTKERWQRIAIEASKQSGSLNILKINNFKTFKELTSEIPSNEGVVVFHPGEGSLNFKKLLEVLENKDMKLLDLNLFLGPEGGFSEKEIAWIEEKRKGQLFWKVRLGDSILKSDTAFIGTISALKFYLEY